MEISQLAPGSEAVGPVPIGTGPVRMGELLARIYAGAWRAEPAPLELSLDEMANVAPNLLDLGGVGLVWPRVREESARYGAVSLALEHGFRQYRRWNEQAPGRVAEAVSLLQRAGIEPVLIKGWSVSRLYPSSVVRLSGDIDLVVSRTEFERANALLFDESQDGVRLNVDLHHDGMWEDMPRADFRAFTCATTLEGVKVPILGPEMQLHVLCHHFIRHAALRPLWLCDIAMALESRPAGFDWELFLGSDPRRAGWAITSLGLAHHLLGAQIDHTPVAGRARSLPKWLIPAVLRRWELAERPPPEVFTELETGGVLHTFEGRWAEPIAATVYMRAPFNNFPRLPIQCATYLKRIVIYGVSRLPRHASQYVRRKRTARRDISR